MGTVGVVLEDSSEELDEDGDDLQEETLEINLELEL